MNKIKGKVICKMAEILSGMDVTNPDEGIKAIKKILAIKELAVVDREAELPEIPNIEYQRGVAGHIKRGMEYIVKKGWVKEVKE